MGTNLRRAPSISMLKAYHAFRSTSVGLSNLVSLLASLHSSPFLLSRGWKPDQENRLVPRIPIYIWVRTEDFSCLYRQNASLKLWKQMGNYPAGWYLEKSLSSTSAPRTQFKWLPRPPDLRMLKGQRSVHEFLLRITFNLTAAVENTTGFMLRLARPLKKVRPNDTKRICSAIHQKHYICSQFGFIHLVASALLQFPWSRCY